jgi:hypothetical protein
MMADLSRGNDRMGSKRGAWSTKSATAIAVVLSRLLS